MEERKSRTASARQRTAPAPSPARPARKPKRPSAASEAAGGRERGLFDRVPVGLYRATPAGKIVGVNSTFLDMSGYPDTGALAAVNAADLYADPVARMRLRAVLEGDGVVEFESRLRRADGVLVPVRAYVRALRVGSGRVESVEGAIIDVTAQTPAKDAVQESTERLRLVARATNDLLWDWDLLTNEGWKSAGAEPRFGYAGDLDRPWPEWWSERIHPEDREKVLIGVRAAIKEGADSWTSEYRFRRSDGEYARVSDRAYIIRDAHRRAVRMVGAMTDLTDRSAVAQEIRRRAAHLEALNAIIVGAAAAPDLHALLEGVIDRTMNALGVPLGAIWVGDLHVDRGLPPEAGRIFTDAREKAAPDLRGAVIASDWPDAPAPLADILAPLQGRYGAWAFLSAPLVKDGRITGGLAIGSSELRSWLPEERLLVAAVGTQVGAAAERLHLFAEAQRRARLMGQLVALSDTLNRSLTVGEVAPAIGEGALSLSGADRVAVFLVEEGAMTCAWSRGLTSRYLSEVLAHQSELTLAQLMREGAELAQVTLPGGRVIEGRKPFQIPDVRVLPPEGLTYTLAASEGYQAVGVWPLTYEGRVIGFVSCYYDAPRTWSEVEEEVFLAFSLQAAVALQNAHLYDAQAQRTAHLESFYARVLDVLTPPDAGKP